MGAWAGDWAAITNDIVITAGIGVVIVRQFIWRKAELSRMLWMPGIWLAGTLGANLADAAGVILLSFWINRLAAIAIVRHRAKALVTAADHCTPISSIVPSVAGPMTTYLVL